MSIGEKIKCRRKELNLTMLDVAKLTGVSEATVSRWESGDIANMRRHRIIALANALQVSPAYLMGWEELPDSAEQSEEELDREIIEGYSRLSEENKKIVSDLIEVLLSRHE